MGRSMGNSARGKYAKKRERLKGGIRSAAQLRTARGHRRKGLKGPKKRRDPVPLGGAA